MDNKNYKVCPVCRAINEQDAKFCRSCGENIENITAVPNEQNAQYAPPPPPPPPYGAPPHFENENAANNPPPPPPPPYGAPPHFENENAANNPPPPPPPPYGAPPQFGNPPQPFMPHPDTEVEDGVTVRELQLFVGKNADKFIPKFIKKASGKKAGFSLLLFLFALFISPIAQSFWFFHRKMNKIGAIVLAIALVFTAVILPFTFDATEHFSSMFGIFVEQISENSQIEDGQVQIDSDDILNSLTDEQYAQVEQDAKKLIFDYIFILLFNLLNLAFGVIVSIFGDYFYYKFAIDKIKQAKSKEFYSQESLMYIGGTKAAVWVIILIALTIAYAVLSVILSANMLSGISLLTNY